MTTSTSPTSSGSSADVTSSKSITCGSIISARAIATRCCWPPESWCGCWSAFSSSPTLASSSRARASASRARHLPDPPRGEREVVDRRQVREEVELLEDDPDALPDRRDVDALARDLLALEEDPARLDRLEQVDAAQQRALAAAARPDDARAPRRARRSGRSRRGRRCRRSSCGRPPCRTMEAPSAVPAPRRLSSRRSLPRGIKGKCVRPVKRLTHCGAAPYPVPSHVVERKEMTMKVAYLISLRLGAPRSRHLRSAARAAARFTIRLKESSVVRWNPGRPRLDRRARGGLHNL